MSDIKFCIDCKHHYEFTLFASLPKYISLPEHKCRHPSTIFTNSVTGETSYLESCRYERDLGNCGPDAKNFEPKDKQ